jgi:uncharacterized protein (TIGR02246 family)
MDDIQAIRLAKTELREAYRRGDVEAVLAVFSDLCSDMSAGNPSFWGAETKLVMRQRLRKLFAGYRAALAITIISVRIQGTLAFDWGWHQLTLTSRKGGRRISKRTRYLEIWQKEADGRWRIAIFMDNLDVPPQMPPREVLHAVARQTAPGKRRPRAKS